MMLQNWRQLPEKPDNFFGIMPNNVKDSILTAKWDLILFRNTDPTKLKDDLEHMFDEFDEAESEMTEGTKMRELQKKEHFLGLLGNSCKAIQNTLDTIDVMDHGWHDIWNIQGEAFASGTKYIHEIDKRKQSKHQTAKISKSRYTVTTMSANATQIIMDNITK